MKQNKQMALCRTNESDFVQLYMLLAANLIKTHMYPTS